MNKILLIIMLFFSHACSLSALDLLTPSAQCNYCISQSCTPTIQPPADFSPRRDRLEIQTAMGSLWANEDVVIGILTERSDLQRLLIAEDYIRAGSTLTDHIKASALGRPLELLQALTKPLPVFYAEELNNAVVGSDSTALIEILTSLPGCAIREISVLFRNMYGQSLYDKIYQNTWFSFKNLMLSLATGDRDEIEEINMEQVKADSEALAVGGVEAWFTDQNKFIEIFTKRSFHQLRETIVAYNGKRKEQNKNYISILHDINTLFSGDVKTTFNAIITNVVNQPAYFARVLDNAMTGFLMIDSKTITRVVRSRCELDLEDIKTQYTSIFDRTLVSRVQQRTSGDYQKTLLALLKR